MTLSLDTAYRSFGGEVEASSTPTICRLPDSRRHQLSAIAQTIMVESIAILEYLLARHGIGSLAVAPDDPAFASYLQFLHLGEAGLAGPMNAVFVGRELAPEAERDARVTCWALETFESRLGLVIRRLADCPYLAGDRFTAADISV